MTFFITFLPLWPTYKCTKCSLLPAHQGPKGGGGVFAVSPFPEITLTSTTIYNPNKTSVIREALKQSFTLPVEVPVVLSAAPRSFSAGLLHFLSGSGSLQSALSAGRKRRKRLRTLKPSKTRQTGTLGAFLSPIWSLQNCLLY